MKTVFSNSMCAHVWAQQTQPHGHSHSMYFEGPTIYSYGKHFPIATFRTPRVVMMNSARYSVSTSRHQSYVSSAVYGLDLDVFTVSAELFNAPPAKVLTYLVEQHTFALEKAARARTNTEWKLSHASDAATTARKWAQLFKLKEPKLVAFDRDVIMARIAEQTKKYAAERKRAAAKLAKETAERITKWRTGEWYGLPGLPRALLRYNSASYQVETSRGASVPAQDAARAVRFISGVKERGKLWRRNGEQCPVGDFQIDEIEPTGNIRAGCHRIEWAEIAQLGVILAAHGVVT